MSKRPLRRLRKLIVGGKVDVNTCVDEITLLGELAEAGDLELVTLMISLGADVNFREIPRVSTPLINATIVGNLKIVKLLLHSGADLVRSDAVFSGLNYALYSKNPPPHEAMNLLLESIPNAAERYYWGGRLLSNLVPYHTVDCLNMLRFICSKGVDLNVKNENGFTALHYARGNKNQEAIKILIEAGATE